MSKKYLDTKEGSLEQSVLGVWQAAVEEQALRETNKNDKSDDGEGLDAVQPKALKKKFKDRKDKDIDNDGDVDDSDEYLHKRRQAVSKAIKKEGLEDSPNVANSQHLCAKNVVHEEWGEGECVPTMHAIPDEDGNVAWYDVMFEHGIEKGVVISELKVTRSEAHENHKKKNGKLLKAKYHEEVELDEAKIAKKVPAKDGGYFVVLHRDTKGMRGTQDKFLMRVLNKGKVKELGSHTSLDGALKFAKNRGIIEEVEESYEWGTDEYRKHTQKVTPGQDITDYQNFKVNSMKEALAKVWGLDENDKKKRQEGKTATGEKKDTIDLNPRIEEKKD